VTLRRLFLSLAVTTLLFGSTAKADCAGDDAACLARLTASASDSNDQATLGIVLVGGLAAWGVYALMQKDDPKDQTDWISRFANGQGLRLANVGDDAFDISVFAMRQFPGSKPSAQLGFQPNHELNGSPSQNMSFIRLTYTLR